MTDSTGILGLDKLINYVMPGDNFVWQTDNMDDFMPYAKAYCEHTLKSEKKLIYFRFAKHKEFIKKEDGAEIYYLNSEHGFEKFITTIHEVIGKTPSGACYIFDSLSDLAVESFSESMIENFFLLTCPRLLKLECLGYFVITRNYNLYHATLPITQTTQLILDIYKYKGKDYIHPVKVDKRHSNTMFMLHAREGEDFVPVFDSALISEVTLSGPWHGLQSAPYRAVGLWDRLFIESEDIIDSCKRGECTTETVNEIFTRQLKQLVSNEERMLEMAKKHMDLSQLISVWKRTIGSGMIGGKSVGMLLAHSILKKEFPRYDEIMEKHDSFYIGSDVFYSFLVQNGCWHIRHRQKKTETLFEGIDEAREKILNGNFSTNIIRSFSDMLDYFGQSPIIVRSSSLLEDNFGNAFSGKYESIFCINKGTHEERLNEFLHAVRVIYASTMNREVLAYRARRNVLESDEQMALLVQRVSGSHYGNVFMPELAGVGFSYNSYTWDESIIPEAGLLRLVYGLGTRAVDRHDDDYTRIVSLSAPNKRPEGTVKDMLKFTQKRVDVLSFEKNDLITEYFSTVIENNPLINPNFFSKELSHNEQKYKAINFDRVLSETNFVKDMSEILKTLKNAYGTQVDIEFTANFTENGKYRINLVQCRPQHVRHEKEAYKVFPNEKDGSSILKVKGGIVGQGRKSIIDRIIYVVPAIYGKLPEQERYNVARIVGKAAQSGKENGKTIMLIGPGRWGTKMPSLGVPVYFSEINTASIICEIGVMHEGLIPDLSMGTHFFNDMVEMNILYIGFFASCEENTFNENILKDLPDSFNTLLPDEKNTGVIKIIECSNLKDSKKIYLSADSIKQSAVLYII